MLLSTCVLVRLDVPIKHRTMFHELYIDPFITLLNKLTPDNELVHAGSKLAVRSN